MEMAPGIGGFGGLFSLDFRRRCRWCKTMKVFIAAGSNTARRSSSYLPSHIFDQTGSAVFWPSFLMIDVSEGGPQEGAQKGFAMEDLIKGFVPVSCTDNNLYICAVGFFTIFDEEVPALINKARSPPPPNSHLDAFRFNSSPSGLGFQFLLRRERRLIPGRLSCSALAVSGSPAMGSQNIPIPNTLPASSSHSASSTSPLCDPADSTSLVNADVLSREEVLRRRSHWLKRLKRCYMEQYWALIEEVREKHQEYYWNHGASPVVEETATAEGTEPIAPRSRCAFSPGARRMLCC